MLSRHLSLKRISSRWPVWAFALALLLKAAVPLLATAAAQVQGKTLVEVCTVYGVSTVAIDDAGSPSPGSDPASDPASDHMADHGGDHCVLSGVLLGAALDAPVAPVLLHAPAQSVAPWRAEACPRAPDACAAWAARLHHGPPRYA